MRPRFTHNPLWRPPRSCPMCCSSQFAIQTPPHGSKATAFNGEPRMTSQSVQFATRGRRTASTSAMGVALTLTPDALNRYASSARLLSIRSRFERLLRDVSQRSFTLIGNSSNLRTRIRRRLVSCMASTWKHSAGVYLTRMPSTCKCCSRRSVSFLRMYIATHTNINISQASMNLSTSEK